ncbi:MAG TPA: hypothetical protein VML95_06090 [Longimicrobiales bacterium]|nr:hypothetical protein [Longimicrobiales bacterium]
MDLRDPWSTTEALLEPVASPLWLRLARADEMRCVRDAAAVLANTENAAEALAAEHPGAVGKIWVVPNGWDGAATESAEVVPPRPRRPFTVSYVGTLYFDRSPRSLFRGLACAIRKTGASPATLRLEIMGRIENGSADQIAAMASQEGVEDFLFIHPPGSRADARALMDRSALLVSLPWAHTLAVPAKIYEYMTFGAWLLVLERAGTAPARMLDGSSALVVDPDDVAGIAEVLRQCYTSYSRGERPTPLAAAGRFSRREAVATLATALDRAVS